MKRISRKQMFRSRQTLFIIYGDVDSGRADVMFNMANKVTTTSDFQSMIRYARKQFAAGHAVTWLACFYASNLTPEYKRKLTELIRSYIPLTRVIFVQPTKYC